MNELRCERSFMMKPIGRLALPGVAASPLEVVQIIGGFGVRWFLRRSAPALPRQRHLEVRRLIPLLSPQAGLER
jgi:hypothetical protein